MENQDFADCFDEATIAHTRSGYKNNWYDVFDDWSWEFETKVVIPR